MEESSYWIIVGSPENFAVSREHGFSIQGMKSRHRKKADRMRPGDKLIYYITGEKAFAGIATVTSTYFEDHAIIWKSTNPKRADEDYPFRVKIEPDLILDDGEHISAETIALQMEYASKWPAKNWTLAFQGNVHQINQHDYELIRSAMVSLEAAAD